MLLFILAILFAVYTITLIIVIIIDSVKGEYIRNEEGKFQPTKLHIFVECLISLFQRDHYDRMY